MARKRIRLAFATIAGALAVGGIAMAAEGPQVVGIAAAVLNKVQVRPASAPQYRPLLLRQRVALADQIETGERSQLQLLLLDKSTFTVGANARLTIDRFVYDPHGRSVAATVAKGAFRFMSGRPDRGGDASIATPVSSIGIRGTIVEGVVGSEAIAIAGNEPALNARLQSDPETASLIVLRGPGIGAEGHVAPGSITVTAANRTVALDRPMLAAYVPQPGAAPIGPFSLSPEGLRRLEALVFASLAEDLRSSDSSGGGYKPVSPYSGSSTPPWLRGSGPFGPGAGAPPGGGGGPGAYTLPALPNPPPQPPPSNPKPQPQPKQPGQP